MAGAPDVVFEVASPATSLKDRREKMELYERSGVAEYFIVDPDAEFIEKYVSSDGKYARARIYAGEETFRIEAVSLELRAKELFPE
ncbi:MAG: Uma2 family endonuclease [Syntrophobacteraceae bacterium]